MYRLIATDIDDTLLAPDGSLPEVNTAVLRRLHERGVTIVFCSGRADVSIREVAARILPPDDDGYYIAFNGARIVRAGTRAEVSRRYVSAEGVRRAVAYARREGLHIQGYAGDEFVVERHNDFVDRYAAATGTAYRRVPDLVDALPDGSPKLLLFGEHGELVGHREPLITLGIPSDRFDGFTAIFSKPVYLELVATGTNKGDALRRLADLLSIPIEQTVAVGDAENDAEMIGAAGLGLAVAGAVPAAKAAADVVLSSEASDGVFREVEQRFFGTA
jgi:Cof subfamily protein (haloacid dehalogenase superfamily)